MLVQNLEQLRLKNYVCWNSTDWTVSWEKKYVHNLLLILFLQAAMGTI